jgi:hypothetical protein
MTEINSHSGNLSNYRQTKHEKNKQKIFFFIILGILTELFQNLNINKSYFCIFDGIRRNFNCRSIYVTVNVSNQSFGHMPLTTSHLAKCLKFPVIWPNDWKWVPSVWQMPEKEFWIQSVQNYNFPQNSINICFHIFFSHYLSKLDVQMYCYSQIIL